MNPNVSPAKPITAPLDPKSNTVKAHCNRSAGWFQRNAFADAESAVLVTVTRVARSDPRS